MAKIICVSGVTGVGKSTLIGTLSEETKKQILPKSGVVKIHIGKVIPPSNIEEIQKQYTQWVSKIQPDSVGESSMDGSH